MSEDIYSLLELVYKKGASDLHLPVGSPPILRLDGRLRPVSSLGELTPEDTEAYMKEIAPERAQEELVECGSADFSYAFEEKARFRCSVFKQKGDIGLVMRMIPNELMSFEEIGLPPDDIKKHLMKPRGLFLVTGPTGSGKSTTLATCIDYINENADRHIITVEDPIEFFHEHKKSIITQRQVGVDVPTFAEALRRGLRMDPDIMLVGEMRDQETIEAAVTAAETGHLVLGTVHTTGAARTINRIVDSFPKEQQSQIRAQLSVALECIISQALMPRADKDGRVAAFEILFMNSACRHLIRENQTHKIQSQIQTGAKEGMQLLDDHLFELFKEDKIDYQTMMRHAQDSAQLQEKVMDSSQKINR
jgi:twitching motility protein PilT